MKIFSKYGDVYIKRGKGVGKFVSISINWPIQKFCENSEPDMAFHENLGFPKTSTAIRTGSLRDPPDQQNNFG